VARINRYSTWSALDMLDRGRRTSLAGVITRPFAKLLSCYLLRGGFLDGSAGLLVSLLTAYYTLLKYTKLWSLHHLSATACRDEGWRQTTPEPQILPFSTAAPSVRQAGVRRAA
jgi:hypothetical protein